VCSLERERTYGEGEETKAKGHAHVPYERENPHGDQELSLRDLHAVSKLDRLGYSLRLVYPSREAYCGVKDGWMLSPPEQGVLIPRSPAKPRLGTEKFP
jgi:hypothetical protein